jgi:DNA repair exonuclease SbcCD ATPase subunit
VDVRYETPDARLPDTDFIHVCCVALSDLASAGGPIKKLLSELQKEFTRHLYSDFLRPAPGSTGLCKVPFFEEARALRAELDHVTSQRAELRALLAVEMKQRRDSEAQLHRAQAELSDAEKLVGECKLNIVNIARVAEHARDNYHRVRDDQEEAVRELQANAKERSEQEMINHQQASAYQMRIAQLSNELDKALEELKCKDREINRLTLACASGGA